MSLVTIKSQYFAKLQVITGSGKIGAENILRVARLGGLGEKGGGIEMYTWVATESSQGCRGQHRGHGQ